MWQCTEKEKAERCGSSGLKSRGEVGRAVVRVRMSCRRRLPITARVGELILAERCGHVWIPKPEFDKRAKEWFTRRPTFCSKCKDGKWNRPRIPRPF